MCTCAARLAADWLLPYRTSSMVRQIGETMVALPCTELMHHSVASQSASQPAFTALRVNTEAPPPLLQPCLVQVE